MYASIKPVISKTFFDLLKIGFGGKYYNLFLDPNIILFVIIDSYLGYLLVNLSNDIFTNINSNNNNNINIWSILAVIFLPLINNINGLLFNKAFLKKKLYVVNNILDYIKNVFMHAPYDFHDKFSINEKYHCFTSSIWGFDSIVDVIISMCSSFIKIITISISIAITNYYIGLLIILSNLLLLFFMPKINNYIEQMNDNKSHKEFYSNAYYNTLFFDENRINPSLNKIQQTDINYSLNQIVSRYSNMHKMYTIGNGIRNLLKNMLLSVILITAFYQEKYNYVMIILLNKSVLFGFSDFYEEFKKTENSNKKNMEELTEMLNFLELYYETNQIYVYNTKIYNKIKLNNLVLTNMNYKFYCGAKLVKKITAEKIIFDFANKKNIILISGKTGSGKSLFTKILTGQADKNEYTLCNDGVLIDGFTNIKTDRIIINQKISEEYTYNGAIRLSLEKLYPQSINFEEIKTFLKNFGMDNKINVPSINSEFNDKLSGGERQRVALSSIVWKILKTNPSFIIIDEPEKGIDEETMIHIMDWLVQIYNGILLLITHNETIKQKYRNKTQSIIKYRFLDEDETDTEMYQEFL